MDIRSNEDDNQTDPGNESPHDSSDSSESSESSDISSDNSSEDEYIQRTPSNWSNNENPDSPDDSDDSSDDNDDDEERVPFTANPRRSYENLPYTAAERAILNKFILPELYSNYEIRKFSGLNRQNFNAFVASRSQRCISRCKFKGIEKLFFLLLQNQVTEPVN